jgi:FkbM family methyltransferase
VTIRDGIKMLLGRPVCFGPNSQDRQSEWFGSKDNGWPILPALLAGRAPCVYSLGIGRDISFDKEMIQRFGAEVFAFDPTPASMAWLSKQDVPASFHAHPLGVAARDGMMPFAPVSEHGVSHTIIERRPEEGGGLQVPVRRLPTILEKLGHRHLDVLKMDIEGAEYEVLRDMAETNIRPTQVLVEFHHRFTGIGFRRTLAALLRLHRLGYRRFFSRTDQYGFVLEDRSAR